MDTNTIAFGVLLVLGLGIFAIGPLFNRWPR